MRRNALIAGVLGSTVLAAGIGWAAGRTVQSPAQIAAKTAAPVPSLITVAVQKRRLSSDVIVRGVVRYGGVQPVSVIPSTLKSGTDILTVPPTVGAALAEGKSAMTISGRPVFVFAGAVPVYRDLTPGTVGDDVRQLQSALTRLGFNPGSANGVYGPLTSAAVARFYTAAGFSPFGPTSTQMRALRSAQATVSKAQLSAFKAQAALSRALSTPPQSAPSSSSQSIPLLQQEAALAQNDLTNANAALSELNAKAGVSVPADEVLFFPNLPLRVQSTKLKAGDAVSGNVMTISTAKLAVDSALSLGDATLVRVGFPAKIEESNLSISVSGHVSVVASGPGTNGVDPQHVYMEVLPDQAPPQLVGASVKVTISVSSTSGKVLVVPASALSLGGDGSSRVQVARGGTTVPVVVHPGLAAGGLVEILPVGYALQAGDRVVVGKNGP